MTGRAEMEAVIEAVLFVAAEPVSRSRLLELFDEDEREEAAAALAAVLARYGGAGLRPAHEADEDDEAEETAEEPQSVLFPPPAGTPEPAAAGSGVGLAGLAVERGASRDSARQAEWQAERQAEWRGIMVEEVAGGVRLVTRPELVGWLRRFFDVAGGTKLSMAALETLAIIAYRQPMTGPEIQELRSVSPVGVLKTLLERRLVRIAGRKEVVGKPFLYATTREFLIHFGLKSLKDLPPLEEFEEAFGGLAPGSSGEMLPSLDREEQILAEAAALDEAAAAAEESAEGEPARGRGSCEPAPELEVLMAEGDEEPA